MNKQDLIAAVAEKTGASKSSVSDFLAATLDEIQGAVKRNDKLTLIGFGSFELAKTTEREGRNPQTGATVKIPAGVRPKFTAGKAFKDFVRS